MFVMLWVAAAASGVPTSKIDLKNVPIEYADIQPIDIRIPISSSVRAATWDQLAVKPSKPVSVRLACIVWGFGAPDACVNASLITQGQKTIDWHKVREVDDLAQESATAADNQIREIAQVRIDSVRITARSGGKDMFVIRFFEEVVSPADARPPFSPGEALTMQDVILKKPLDGTLIQALFPIVAMRYSVTARVNVTCHVEPDLRLLCRDLGTINAEPANVGAGTLDLIQSLRFATYQLASTMELEPKSKNGDDIVGRDVRFGILWTLPR